MSSLYKLLYIQFSMNLQQNFFNPLHLHYFWVLRQHYRIRAFTYSSRSSNTFSEICELITTSTCGRFLS